MRKSVLSFLATVAGSAALSIPTSPDALLQPRQSSSCENTPKSRNCWGDYSTDTNYYETTPETGKTVEKWLSVEEGPCAPDGYQRTCMTFNGTIPGPTIIADWGDNLVIHVTNNMSNNGTSVHWHGLRQLNNSINDGVPGVSQCGIAPGETQTYRMRVTQYGSTWYHSHFSLQYAEGLFGGMVLRGPTTDHYDEDLGVLFLQDWSHKEAFALWDVARTGNPVFMETGLINGTNSFDCSTSTDPNCKGTGKKFETVFEKDKKYLLRLINSGTDAAFQFSIDGHSLRVVAHDLVPIVPYTTDNVQLTIGQRYDVIVEANAEPGDYWIRGGWITDCLTNYNALNITGIVRYDATSTSDPTSSSTVTTSHSCLGEPLENTEPYLKLNVANLDGGVVLEDLSFGFNRTGDVNYFQWTVNTSSLRLDWGNPTLKQVFEGKSIFPTEYNVVSVNASGTDPEWAVLVIQDLSNIPLAHPIHMHGHDFWVVGMGLGTFSGDTSALNTTNPSRRDTSTLPAGGYLALAFQLDNPGAWLTHCHIAWHASQGLSLELVENQAQIVADPTDRGVFDDICKSWSMFKPVYEQDDSGI
ncbi:multicopper oxidase-domain-containing protein [Chaetomium strumarium]|uniref:Multicopper oxidase-domain-containing protein n=1 Tax=Chaetomium strumarium TaxID=1170767 RepID=A0AAJ0LZ83_9PEZI|nr:multicopper oxidase-domain-containing protein [Chaetomium strumarium]